MHKEMHTSVELNRFWDNDASVRRVRIDRLAVVRAIENAIVAKEVELLVDKGKSELMVEEKDSQQAVFVRLYR